MPRSLQQSARLRNESTDDTETEEDDDVLQLPFDLGTDEETEAEEAKERERERYFKTREKFRTWLQEGKLEEKPVEISVKHQNMPFVEIFSPGGIEEMDINFKDMFGSILPNQTKKRRLPVSEARKILMQEESRKTH